MKAAVFIQNRDFWGARLTHLPLLYSLRKSGFINEIHVFSPYDSGNFFRDPGKADSAHHYQAGIFSTAGRLRELNMDIAISMRPSSQWLDSAIRLSGIRCRIGFRTALSRVTMTHTVKQELSIYRAVNFLRLLEPLGIEGDTRSCFAELAENGQPLLPENRIGIAFLPGGGAGEFKRWGIDNFIDLGIRLIRRDGRFFFLFILGPDESDYVSAVKTSPLRGYAEILFNRSVSDIARAASDCILTVGNDCGPAQIAQMMRVPYIGLFSDHDGLVKVRIEEWFYPHSRAEAVKSMPGTEVHSISVDQVETAAMRLLSVD